MPNTSRLAFFLSPFSLLLSLMGQASASNQGVPVALEGDSVPGAGALNFVYDVDATVDGGWSARVDTFFALAQDGVILGPTGTLLQEGLSLPAPVGASVGILGAYDRNSDGDLVALCGVAGVPSGLGDEGIVFNGELVLRTGEPATAAGLGAGTIWTFFDEIKLNGGRQLLLLAAVDDPALPGTIERGLYRLQIDAGGQLVQQELVVRVGQVLAGNPLPVGGLWPSANNSAINELGQSIWVGYLGGSNSHGVIVSGSNFLAESGTASPILNHPWNGIGGGSSVAISANGDLAYTGLVSGPDFTGEIIVKNNAVFRRMGESFPAIAPYVITDFENVAIEITDDGRIAWYAEWSDPDTTRNSGLFLEHELIVQEGVTQVAGSVVAAFEDNLFTLDVAADGSCLVFEATLVDGSEGTFLFSIDELGSRYCDALPNSVSVDGARISASGSTSIADNDLVLSAGPIQAGRVGLFIYGGAVNNGGAGTALGDGLLCVAGGITRLPVIVSNGAGVLTHAVDNQASSIAAGLSLYFQAWHRDPGGPGGSGFNLTDALVLVFVP